MNAAKITTNSSVFVTLVLFVIFVPERHSSGAQQTQRPVFRVGAHFVSVDAYPTRDGKIIEGLQQGDFDIYEDDRPQKIETFEFISASTRPPDDERGTLLTPREGLELAADPHYRVFVIVIDRTAVSFGSWPAVNAALHDFLDTQVSPRDLIGLTTTDASWQDLVIGKRLSAIEEEIDNPEWLRVEPAEEQQVLEGCNLAMLRSRARSDATYGLLESIVRVLGQVREDHSSIVFVTNNLTRMPRDTRGAGNQRTLHLPNVGLVNGKIGRVPSTADMHEAYCKAEAQRLTDIDFDRRFSDLAATARASNVSFYPIHVPMPVFQPAAGFGPPGGGRGMRPMASGPHLRAEDNLPDLAKKTDGFPIAVGEKLRDGFRRIAEDVGAHYLLGYYTDNDKWDGKIRHITVRLKPKGTQISARREYRAPTREEIAALSSRKDTKTLARPPAVGEALGLLSHLRPSAQFYVYGAVADRTMTVSVEVPPEGIDAGRWSEGATLELIADSAGGDAVGTAHGRLASTGRALIAVPLDGSARPANLFVRLHADGEAITERIAISTQPGTLVGDPVVYRSGPRGAGVPVASFLFSRQDRARFDWTLVRPVARYEVRVLDQFGQPLQLHPEIQELETAAGKHLVGELALAPLARGDYVVEMTVVANGVTEQKYTALRVR